MATIFLATCAQKPSLDPDDELLLGHFPASIRVEVGPWDQPGWRHADLVVVRSTWDYHQRLAEFEDWLAALEAAAIPVVNPLPALRWNLRKRYLRDLEKAGVAIVPTVWVPVDAEIDAGQVLEEHGWNEVVIKPEVAATAHRTVRQSAVDRVRLQSALESLQAVERDLESDRLLLVQPLLGEILEDGEWSLIFLGGEFSHAVRKEAVQGDFRVQSDFGGRAVRERPSNDLLEQARVALTQAAARLGTEPLYARVDGVVADGSRPSERAGRFLLMELELIEPQLFLACGDGAARRLAELLGKRLPDATGESPLR